MKISIMHQLRCWSLTVTESRKEHRKGDTVIMQNILASEKSVTKISITQHLNATSWWLTGRSLTTNLTQVTMRRQYTKYLSTLSCRSWEIWKKSVSDGRTDKVIGGIILWSRAQQSHLFDLNIFFFGWMEKMVFFFSTTVYK